MSFLTYTYFCFHIALGASEQFQKAGRFMRKAVNLFLQVFLLILVHTCFELSLCLG